tara:strand:+ start:628 stop:816 length:189 start_codon:yes stop_codon:yes gene_type:complete
MKQFGISKGMRDGIQIIVTKNGKTKATTMDIEKWIEERDAQDGIAPLDSKVYDMVKFLDDLK